MNCKQGDLAVIVYAGRSGRDLGKLVNVIRGNGYDEDGDFMWECESSGTPLFAYTEDGYGPGIESPKALIPDAWLRPIRPGDLEETLDTDIKKPDEVEA
jgi:hypothetical protein